MTNSLLLSLLAVALAPAPAKDDCAAKLAAWRAEHKIAASEFDRSPDPNVDNFILDHFRRVADLGIDCIGTCFPNGAKVDEKKSPLLAKEFFWLGNDLNLAGDNRAAGAAYMVCAMTLAARKIHYSTLNSHGTQISVSLADEALLRGQSLLLERGPLVRDQFLRPIKTNFGQFLSIATKGHVTGNENVWGDGIIDDAASKVSITDQFDESGD